MVLETILATFKYFHKCMYSESSIGIYVIYIHTYTYLIYNIHVLWFWIVTLQNVAFICDIWLLLVPIHLKIPLDQI